MVNTAVLMIKVMCTSCRAVGYWFEYGPVCADCAVSMNASDINTARADGYPRGDVCTECRDHARAVVAVLRGELPANALRNRWSHGGRIPEQQLLTAA